MKAIVYTIYGPPDVLQLQEIEKLVPKRRHLLLQEPYDSHHEFPAIIQIRRNASIS